MQANKHTCEPLVGGPAPEDLSKELEVLHDQVTLDHQNPICAGLARLNMKHTVPHLYGIFVCTTARSLQID